MKQFPKGWDEVSIRKFIQYHTIITGKFDDSFNRQMNLLACFMDCSLEDVEKLKLSEISEYAGKMGFIQELPKNEKLPVEFKCGDKTFTSTLLWKNMTAGQFMNFSDVLKGVKPEDYIYHIHELLGCMCIEKGKRYDGYKETADLFYSNLTIDKAYPFFVFFCKLMPKLLEVTQNYLMKEVMKLKAEKINHNHSMLTGVGLQ